MENIFTAVCFLSVVHFLHPPTMGNWLSYFYPSRDEELDEAFFDVLDEELEEAFEANKDFCDAVPMELVAQEYFEQYQTKFDSDKEFAQSEKKQMNFLDSHWKAMNRRQLADHCDWVTKKICTHETKDVEQFFVAQLDRFKNYKGPINTMAIANMAQICERLGKEEEWSTFFTNIHEGRQKIVEEKLV